jgi:methyl-accepting chemotaxis protein
MKLSDLKILHKILICFVLFSVVVAAAIWFATSRMSMIDAEYSAIIADDVAGLDAAERANTSLQSFRRSIWRIIAETNDTQLQQAVQDKEGSLKQIRSLIDEAKTHAPLFASRLEGAQQKFEALIPDYGRVEKLRLANEVADASAENDNLTPKVAEVAQLLSSTIDDMMKSMNVRSDRASEAANRTIFITYAAITIAVAAVFGLAFLLVRFGVTGPLAALVVELRKIADGNFDVRVPGVGRGDEIGMIASAAEAVVERVGTTIGNIKQAAHEVTSASAEISTSTTDLSQRTEEQASSLEEISASMEQISATVKKNAENARRANEFATETSKVAERGGGVVSAAVSAMERIEKSSRKISDIISVIDEIARQTNMLALNAAVEAARAGEAGRGFAVVASEVRSLAQRSAQAAKDIKDLITNSNSQVKDGVDLVNKAGESLDEIVASIKKVATIVADIADASMEQSSGVEQVNKALTQMDKVTQQNSALVEENAATAKTLEQQAKSMDERVAAFRLRSAAALDAFAAAAIDSGGGEVVWVTPHAPKLVTAAAPKRALDGGGPVGRMQTALATAVQADDDWTEF